MKLVLVIIQKGFGIANIYTGSPYAVQNNYVAYGSLTIGGTLANYGEALSWCSSTAGLFMECADYMMQTQELQLLCIQVT